MKIRAGGLSRADRVYVALRQAAEELRELAEESSGSSKDRATAMLEEVWGLCGRIEEETRFRRKHR